MIYSIDLSNAVASIKLFVEANRAEFEKMRGFSENIQIIFDSDVKLNDLTKKSVQIMPKVSNADVDDVRLEAVGHIIDIENKVLYCGTITRNKSLSEIHVHSGRELLRAGDSIIIATGLSIIDLTQQFPETANFGVSVELVQALQKSVSDLKAIKPLTKQAKDELKALNDEGKVIMIAMNEAFRVTDIIMEAHKREMPVLYEKWQKARAIPIRKSVSSAILINTFKENEDILGKVKYSIWTLDPESMSIKDKKPLIEKETNENGNSRISTLTDGYYLIKFGKIGFDTQEVKIAYVQGEQQRVKVLLKGKM